MALDKVTYVDGTTVIGATNLNAIQDEIIANASSISGKQATLVSGTNIKTINNQSILGDGNLTISGGISYEVIQ